MQIRQVLIKVDDQDKALAFYTSKLGFVKHLDIPIQMGKMRWLTVTSPDGAEGVEIVLETDDFPAVKEAKRMLHDAGFPVTVLTSGDIDADYQRLKGLGVEFRGEPKNLGRVSTVTFEDGCGNLINLVQTHNAGAV